MTKSQSKMAALDLKAVGPGLLIFLAFVVGGLVVHHTGHGGTAGRGESTDVASFRGLTPVSLNSLRQSDMPPSAPSGAVVESSVAPLVVYTNVDTRRLLDFAKYDTLFQVRNTKDSLQGEVRANMTTLNPPKEWCDASTKVRNGSQKERMTRVT